MGRAVIRKSRKGMRHLESPSIIRLFGRYSRRRKRDMYRTEGGPTGNEKDKFGYSKGREDAV